MSRPLSTLYNVARTRLGDLSCYHGITSCTFLTEVREFAIDYVDDIIYVHEVSIRLNADWAQSI